MVTGALRRFASPNTLDTLIIGGGPIGLSTAYHLALARGDGSDIAVVERDPTYTYCSATLSAGGIRQQFSLEENVKMSMYGRDFLRSANERLRVDDEEVDVQFQEHGYLFLASSEKGKQQLTSNNQVQRSAGADIHLLDKNQLGTKFPWLNTRDILLGSFGESGEGWFDPWALIRGLRRKCQSMGVDLVSGEPVSATRCSETGSVEGVEIRTDQKGIQSYAAKCVVNAAGAHCQSLMDLLAGGKDRLAYNIPVEPRKRSIFFFQMNTEQDLEMPVVSPLTVCPTTGVYFRSEGLIDKHGRASGNFLGGVSPAGDVDRAMRDMDELSYADHDLWDEIIWPALYNRVEAFGDIKVKSSWAGLYEFNFIDQNAIIDTHPEIPNVIMVNGFSGHGLQQSPSAGRAVAELIEHGCFATLDLSIFSFNRLVDGQAPVFEAGIV